MAEMLARVCAGTVALVLLAAFAGHLLHPRGLPAALTAHRTVPAPLTWPVTLLVVGLEGLLGTVTGYAVLAGRAHLLTLAACGCAVLLAAYAVYGSYVVRTRPGVPCGCAAGGTPMSGWVAGRAAALAAGSLAAAAGAGQAVASPAAHVAITGLASLVFAALLWLLPLAMFDPGRNPAG